MMTTLRVSLMIWMYPLDCEFQISMHAQVRTQQPRLKHRGHGVHTGLPFISSLQDWQLAWRIWPLRLASILGWGSGPVRRALYVSLRAVADSWRESRKRCGIQAHMHFDRGADRFRRRCNGPMQRMIFRSVRA